MSSAHQVDTILPQLVRVLGICAEISIPGRGADVRALAAVDCAGGTWEAQLSSPALQFVMRMREVRSVQHCVGSEVPACLQQIGAVVQYHCCRAAALPVYTPLCWA